MLTYLPSLNYGGHPYHHVGMPGTIIMPEEVVKKRSFIQCSVFGMMGIER